MALTEKEINKLLKSTSPGITYEESSPPAQLGDKIVHQIWVYLQVEKEYDTH